MVFSSVSFVFMFLPIVLLFYYISAERYKNIVLLIASLLFYSFGEPTAFWLMLVSIGINYIAGYFLDHLISPHGRKAVLIVDVVCNLGILFFFKYLDYTISIFNYFSDNDILTLNIALPIGISFFTFQGMSYVIDVYRREVAAEKNILTVGLYISFFPQLIAGPIVRYHSIAEQLRCRTVSVDQIADGVKRFLLGFCKKVLLANQLALLAESAFQYEDFTSRPIALAWLGSIAYSLQIFYDFAGYSDMAIGLGKMFGFEFEENFNYPYIARSVTDFWRRWHISLSRWFRDYVYIPLGGDCPKTSPMNY